MIQKRDNFTKDGYISKVHSRKSSISPIKSAVCVVSEINSKNNKYFLVKNFNGIIKPKNEVVYTSQHSTNNYFQEILRSDNKNEKKNVKSPKIRTEKSPVNVFHQRTRSTLSKSPVSSFWHSRSPSQFPYSIDTNTKCSEFNFEDNVQKRLDFYPIESPRTRIKSSLVESVQIKQKKADDSINMITEPSNTSIETLSDLRLKESRIRSQEDKLQLGLGNDWYWRDFFRNPLDLSIEENSYDTEEKINVNKITSFGGFKKKIFG